MQQRKKILVTREVWSNAWATFKATKRQTLLLALVGLAIPQMAMSLYFDVRSSAVVDQVRAVFTSKTPGSPGPFYTLLEPAMPMLQELGVCALLIFLLSFASYFGLVQTAVDCQRGEPPRGAWKAWLAGLRTTLPAGLVVALVIFFLILIGQVLIAPAVLMAVLGLMLPVVLVTERAGVWRSLWGTLGLRYVRGSGYSGWAVMLNLLSLAALFYAFLAGTGLLWEEVLVLDEHLNLPRTLWAMTLPGLPFGPVYLGVALAEAGVSMLLVAALPSLTAALYFTVARGRQIARA